MAELERVKKDKKMYTALNSLKESVDKTLKMAYKSVQEIETSSTDHPTGSSHNKSLTN